MTYIKTLAPSIRFDASTSTFHAHAVPCRSLLMTIFLLSGRAASGSLRPVTQDLLAATSGTVCNETFLESDVRIKKKAEDYSITDAARTQVLEDESKAVKNTSPEAKACWRSGLEHHAKYDFFSQNSTIKAMPQMPHRASHSSNPNCI